MQNTLMAVTLVLLFFIIKNRFMGISSENVKNVTGEEANEIIKQNKDIVILDVRTKGEYQGGHIPDAKCYPVSDLNSRIGELEKFKGRPILVYCASGGRSPRAVKTLLKNNFTKIYHLNRGISSWGYKLKR